MDAATQDRITEFFSTFGEDKRGMMIDAFLTSIRQHREVCAQSVDRQDSAAFRASSHDLKSVCRTMGAEDIGTTAETIEKLIIDEKSEKAFPMSAPFVAELDKLIAYLDGIQ